MDYLDRGDLILDGGGLAFDLFTVGVGGRYTNVVEIIGKGIDQADFVAGAVSVTRDNTNNEADWYTYLSFSTDVAGIFVPIVPDAVGLILNGVHANQLYIQSLKN